MPWAQCTVERAGPAENGVIYIHLKATNGAFNTWFNANTQMEKEMLAVALSAIGGGKQVTTYLTATTAYSTVNRIYLNA